MASAEFCAVAVAVVFVGVPVTGDGCAEEPYTVLSALGEAAGAAWGVSGAVWGWGILQPVGGAANGVE